MPKKAGIVFVIIGAVLILSALSLFLFNQNEDAQAGQEAAHRCASRDSGKGNCFLHKAGIVGGDGNAGSGD